MAGRISASAVAFLALAACQKQEASAPLEKGWAPPGACSFVGNRADRHYCATTGTQLLANPEIYNGQLVLLSGWAVSAPDGEAAGLFLTKDALETSALYGALRLTGPAVPAIVARRDKLEPWSPLQVRVVGRFHLHGLAPDGTRRNKSPWFGVLEEVREDY
ncbi:hypothetical protein [Lysobacter humi (ex Lee et al. 2017)]